MQEPISTTGVTFILDGIMCQAESLQAGLETPNAKALAAYHGIGIGSVVTAKTVELHFPTQAVFVDEMCFPASKLIAVFAGKSEIHPR